MFKARRFECSQVLIKRLSEVLCSIKSASVRMFTSLNKTLVRFHVLSVGSNVH